MPQERRSYSKSFKAQVIAECAQVAEHTLKYQARHQEEWERLYVG